MLTDEEWVEGAKAVLREQLEKIILENFHLFDGDRRFEYFQYFLRAINEAPEGELPANLPNPRKWLA